MHFDETLEANQRDDMLSSKRIIGTNTRFVALGSEILEIDAPCYQIMASWCYSMVDWHRIYAKGTHGSFRYWELTVNLSIENDVEDMPISMWTHCIKIEQFNKDHRNELQNYLRK